MGVKGGKNKTSVSAGFRVFDLIINWSLVIRLGFGIPPESIDFTTFLKRPSEKMSTKLATLRFCDQPGIRTQDPRLKRAMLYRLS